jgi:HlyD family secretion protein
MQRRRSLTTGAFFLLATVAPFAVCAEEPAANTPKPDLPSIIVTEAVSRPLVDRVVASGTIRPVDEIYVQPQVEGLSIYALNADIGDRVEANAVLAVLSTDSLLLQKSQFQATRAKAQASLAQSQAQVAEARASFSDAVRQRDRAVTLGKNGPVSTSQIEQLTSAVETATARLQAAQQSAMAADAEIKVVDSQIADTELKLSRTSVRTPVAGIISARNAKVGAIASGSGQPLFTIIQAGDIELVADVAETDLLKIRAGLKAAITVPGAPEPLAGSVRLVSPTVDPSTRLGSVHVQINEDQKARVGMYASAAIIVEETNGLALPLSAVTTSRDGSITRRIEDGVVRQVSIQTGIQDGAYIQVLDGLSPGDKVVEKAGAFVRDGDRIKPVDRTSQISN